MCHNVKATTQSKLSREEMAQLRNSGVASQAGHVQLPAQTGPARLENSAAARGLKALQQDPPKLHFVPKEFADIHCSLAAGALQALGALCLSAAASGTWVCPCASAWLLLPSLGLNTLCRCRRRDLLGRKPSTLGTEGSKLHTPLPQLPKAHPSPGEIPGAWMHNQPRSAVLLPRTSIRNGRKGRKANAGRASFVPAPRTGRQERFPEGRIALNAADF